jgi:S1-C subfamily serine protease
MDCHRSDAVSCAVAVLPKSGNMSPWLPLQEPPVEFVASFVDNVHFTVDLTKFSPDTELIYLVLYASKGSTTLKPLGEVSLTIDGHLLRLFNEDLAFQSVTFAEIYRRQGKWKVRAKKDGVFAGVEETGRRHGIPVVDRLADVPPVPIGEPSGASEGSENRERDHDWTGSGMMIAEGVVLTNAHVVDGARSIEISGFSGRASAQPIIIDERNDLALIRIQGNFGQPTVSFREAGVLLGEHAHAIGYPLSGLLGRGPQFTSGAVSNLLGPRDDGRLLQITCPIQPGSSGGPVFDEYGNIMAIVTASLSNAQNVNFAIRSSLALALLDAASIPYQRRGAAQPVPVSEIVRQYTPFVWRVECSR